nr:hypothetical protein [Tanacetum cinerariifolium]
MLRISHHNICQLGSNTRIAKEVGSVEGNLYTDNRSCGFKLKDGGSNTRIAKEVGNVEGNLYTDNRSCGFKLKKGGSILDILDEMIKVGQTMGFSMDGCTKDMEGIIGAQGDNVKKQWNFSDGCTARDLWKACNEYDTVVDVFIPAKKSKAGKRFVFVRFIKVRFARPPRADQSSHPPKHVASGSPSFVSAVKGPTVPFPYASSSPVLVLDDSCEANRDLDNCVMGEVKRFSSINNLRVLLSNKGFNNVKLAYLGGLWVMIDLHSSQVKAKFMSHVGVASWFGKICSAQSDFVSRERIVWVDIEGVPLHAWSRESFCKIGSKWGEVIDLEETLDDCFARKRICIKTKQEDSILKGFKIIIRGKVYIVRAKELAVWTPSFNEVNNYCSDDESVKGSDEVNDKSCNHGNSDAASDVEEISDTVFGDADVKNDVNHDQVFTSDVDKPSPDPFNIYDLLNNKNDRKDNSDKDSSLPYPPGFTPNLEPILSDDHKTNAPSDCVDHKQSDNLSSRVVENNKVVDEYHSSNSHGLKRELNTGGSILDVLDIMINIGHTMGYNMEGCVKDMEKIIASQGVRDDIDVKILWGNYSFEYMLSGALGNSGGILCAWDPNSFGKDHHIISDNFVAIYGTWKPTRSKILFISVYAPQSIPDKRLLWSYLSSIISQWDGDCIVMRDFNEVRYVEEQMGSLFNPQGAIEFNSFINNSGLIDVHLEGYSFTWAHPSTSKMSKLNRFLVTEGVISSFPCISVVCLDKHLSDHRPILLRDVVADYGAIHFRFFNSWLHLDGFGQMVSSTWSSIDLDDRNGMICRLSGIQTKLRDIDVVLDQGGANNSILSERKDLLNKLNDLKSSESHGEWVDNPIRVKYEFHSHFATRSQAPATNRCRLEFQFPRCLSPDFCLAVDWFFQHHSFANGCNSSFVALIPKINDPKIVNDYRPISLIGSIYKVKQIMMFKVDFAKAYDSVSLNLGMASILVNGSPTAEFPFHCGLKQGDPLAPFLFILIMESLHLSFMRVVEAGLFKGIQLGSSLSISHLFYADDAVFIGLKINIMKRNLLGVGVSRKAVSIAARNIGCLVMSTPFKYLGVMVGGNMSLTKSWDAILGKLKSRLSKWKRNTLSIGGRLTLLKSVLGSTPIYAMSLYKTPKSVLHSMESIRRKFFYEANDDIKKITWISWSKVLAAKDKGGLGVSSLYGLNRALLFKWVWRFLSKDNSLWSRVNYSIHGDHFSNAVASHSSLWKSISREIGSIKSQGIDLISHCRMRSFPRMYTLENSKDCYVADKFNGSLLGSFRRIARGGIEEYQLSQLRLLLEPVILSPFEDRWVWILSNDGGFRVKDVRRLLDDFFLPKSEVATRWVKCVPIKINVFAWRVLLDRLPTRLNLFVGTSRFRLLFM